MQKTWHSVAQGGGVEMKIEAGGLFRITQRFFKLPQPGLILRLYSYWPTPLRLFMIMSDPRKL